MVEPLTIIGAGLAGLSCAYHYDGPSIIFEKASSVGGVARTFERHGFLFDCTGHWLHLKDAGIRSLVFRLLQGNIVEIRRRAEIHSHGVRTPYPFQANTFGLPTQVVADCLLGYFAARERAAVGKLSQPKNFEEHIRQTMGDGIAEHFMLPYNSKLWTIPPSEMDYAWSQRFVPTPSPEEVVLGALQSPAADQALGYNSRFFYPKQGGMGVLARKMADALKSSELSMQQSVRAIELKDRRILLSHGRSHGFDRIVSTIPLPDLVNMVSDVPNHVRDAAGQLRSISVTHWDIGVPGKNKASEAHWIYFPDANVPFYRVGSPSAALASLAPENHRSYYVEVSHPRHTSCDVREEDILKSLRRVGVLGQHEEPVVCERSTIECAYVVMDAHYSTSRRTVLDWLEEQRIHSIGRYGAWIYDSMEGAMIQGRDTAYRLSTI